MSTTAVKKTYIPRKYGHMASHRTIISACVPHTVAIYMHHTASAAGISMSRWLTEHFAAPAAALAAQRTDQTPNAAALARAEQDSLQHDKAAAARCQQQSCSLTLCECCKVPIGPEDGTDECTPGRCAKCLTSND